MSKINGEEEYKDTDKIKAGFNEYMNEIRIAVIGLGYVGLPLARLFSTKFRTVGFDMNQAHTRPLQ